MPTFPTYHGPPLPEVLNPLNPRDYWLLFTWIFFQPSRLKYYLYSTEPELYRERDLGALLRILRLPAYRNMYVMFLLFTSLLSGGVAWAVSLAQATPMNWWGLAGVVVLCVATVVVFVVVFGVASVAVFGVARSVVEGMAGIVAVEVALGVAFVMVVGVALGTMDVMVVGVAFSVAMGMVLGVASGVIDGAGGRVARGMVEDMALGVAVGVVFGVTVGVVGDVTGSVLGGVAGGVVVGVAGCVAGCVGASRMVFHLFEWPLAWLHAHFSYDPFRQLESHPMIWDELSVWPLPGAERLLRACLSTDLKRGLALATRIVSNPFQRWAAQRALLDFIAAQADPLTVLYQVAHLSALDDYLLPPVALRQFDQWPSARVVLLGEIGQAFVDGTGGQSETSERLVWRLTRRLRRMKATPLSAFSRMLYELFRDETELESQIISEIALAERFALTYEGVRPFRCGDEVADSFATIAFFLKLRTLGGMAGAYQKLAWAKSLTKPLLRSTVIEVIKALGDVSQDAAAFKRSTSNVQKSAVLNRAAGALNELARYIEKEVKQPERVLLKRVVGLWQSIVATEQGKLGEAALREMTPAARRATETAVERASAVWQRPLTPFDNPYVAGNPVAPPLFVGRALIFNRIGEVWSAKQVPDSIILYGHRRMGKSSILRNLNQAAPEGSVIAYADMAGETSFVESTPDLLLGLAEKIYTALRSKPRASTKEITRPDPAAYNGLANAGREFNRFAEQARAALDGQVLILALDEFEAVERAVEVGKIGKEIYSFLRAKTQEPWITLVLGGLHTLDEMSRDYQQPFYGSYENIRVSYLAHADAWRLITNPTEDFMLNYEPEAVERIIAETGGQPYLVQQVCRDALDHLNHELIDERRERDAIISLADVEAVLGLDFFQRGTVYFDGVWNQASDPGHQTLLRAMARRHEPWTLPELESATQLPPDALSAALRWAERHDILRASGESAVWDFHVPLMRRWVSERAR